VVSGHKNDTRFLRRKLKSKFDIRIFFRQYFHCIFNQLIALGNTQLSASFVIRVIHHLFSQFFIVVAAICILFAAFLVNKERAIIIFSPVITFHYD
jgi:hypothetical protein